MTQVVDDAFTYLTVSFLSSWGFEICGVTVAIVTRSPDLLSLCQNYFRFYRNIAQQPLPPVPSPIKLRLKLVNSTSSLGDLIPAGAEYVGEQEITTIWKTLRRGREQFYFHFSFGNALFRVEPANGKIVGMISPDAFESPHLMVNTYVFMTLMLALRGRGVYHLHTAAVLSPEQQLMLICGGQRAGKTTLVTALGVAGWHPISDDGLVLRAASRDRAELQACKRDFHLAAVLLQQWEALQAIAVKYFYHDRACVDGLAFFQTAQLSDSTFSRVDRVLFPQITGEAKSWLEPMPKSEAIRRLIGQSMFFPLGREHTQAQLAVLTTLTKRASFDRLWAGKDFWEDPQQAALLLKK
jgi:hypothetical protein